MQKPRTGNVSIFRRIQNIVRKGVTRTAEGWYPARYVRDPSRTDDFCEYWQQAVDSSVYASAAADRRRQFIGGKGFVSDRISNRPVNENMTLGDLHLKVVQDFSLFERVAIRVMPNRGGSRIIELHHIEAEWVRYGFPEKDGEINVAYYIPFINSTEDRGYQFECLPLWEPGKMTPARIREEIKYVEKKHQQYKGHVFYYNVLRPGHRIYSRPRPYSSVFDAISDGRMSESLERFTANAFMLGGILKVVGDPNEGILTGPNGEIYKTRQDLFSEELAENFSGSASTGSIMTIWQQAGEDAPEWIPFDPGGTHELIKVSDATLLQRISTAFQIPAILLGIQTAGRLGQSTEFRQAIQYANQTTEEMRTKLETIYRELLRDFSGVNTNNILLDPIQDFTDLPDSVFASLTSTQKQTYIEESFGIEADPEGVAQQQVQQLPPEQDAGNETDNSSDD